MNYRTPLLPTLTLVVALVVAPAPAAHAAGDDDNPFSLNFSAGAEYDSNVAVLELDTSSGEGDVAALIEAGLGFAPELTERLTLKLGYDFSQTLHEEFDAFDVRIHRGSGELSYDFGRIDAGVSHVYADAELDGNGFLELTRTEGFASRLFGKRLFLRLAFARSDKVFDNAPSRDAEADAWSGDAFIFIDGVDRFVVLGYQHVDEDAIDDQLDHDGGRAKLQFNRRFDRGKHANKLKLEVRHESRDYRTTFLPLAEPRRDDRYGFLGELEVPFAEKAYLRFRYRYNDNRSNLQSVDFDEHVGSVEIGARF